MVENRYPSCSNLSAAWSTTIVSKAMSYHQSENDLLETKCLIDLDEDDVFNPEKKFECWKRI